MLCSHKANIIIGWDIWASKLGAYEECRLLGCGVVYILCKPMFRRNISQAKICLLPASRWLLARLIIRRWRWRRHILPKRRLTLNWLHGIMCQKINNDLREEWQLTIGLRCRKTEIRDWPDPCGGSTQVKISPQKKNLIPPRPRSFKKGLNFSKMFTVTWNDQAFLTKALFSSWILKTVSFTIFLRKIVRLLPVSEEIISMN
jgi:hypothetical protein